MTHDAPKVVTLEATSVAMQRETVPMSELPGFFDRAYHNIMEVAQAQGVHPTGPPVGVYYSMPSDTVDVGAGFPTDGEVTAERGVTAALLPGGQAVEVVHQGSYESLEQTYAELMAWVQQQGLRLGPLMWETYTTEPTAPPEETITLITWPLAT